MQKEEDILLIKNPSSKSGKGKRNWKFYEKFDSETTTSRENAVYIVENTTKTIISAVGGDGTINQCVNGIMKSGGKKSLSVLYSGTSPDFCKYHNIPTSPKEAVNTLMNGNITEVDVCSVTDSENEYWFSSSCNIGLGAKVAATSNKIRRFLGDFTGTLIALIYAIVTSKPFNARIEIDSKSINLNNLYHIFIIKNNFIASGLKVNINNPPDSGVIYAAVIKKDGIKNLIKNVVSLYKGDITDDILIGKGESVYIETEPKQYIEFDGDAYYSVTTPVNIKCHRKALKLIK